MADTLEFDRRDWARTLLGEIAERERALESGLRSAERRLTQRLAQERMEWIADLRSRRDALTGAVVGSAEARRTVAILTAPVIYAMIVPLALIDLFFTVYQTLCFGSYGIPRVDRRAYVVIDRQHLEYLNAFEKLNCVYCGYANGVIAYVREIAARTEQYWCPIKHARIAHGAHDRYAAFMEYGSAEFESGREALRKALADEGSRTGAQATATGVGRACSDPPTPRTRL